MQSSFISELESLQPADLDAGAVFSGSSSGKKVKGYAEATPFTPAVDANYIFHEQVRDIAVWFIDRSDPLYVFGPPSVGKTSVIKQVAARLHYPVFEITGHNRLEFQDMVGHHTVQNGNMTFQYGLR
jgi:cobaltochelatase CobS